MRNAMSVPHSGPPLYLRPRLSVGHRCYSTFQVCAIAGALLGFALSMALGLRIGLSLSELLGLAATIALTLWAVLMATCYLAGDEVIVVYHHMLAAVLVAVAFLRLTHQPLLPYLDVAFLGFGLLHAFGRIGCLAVGCCHGRPAGHGVTYNHEHAGAGFPPHLVGVKLIPIQIVESLLVLSLVIVGATGVVHGRPPGSSVSLYLLGYALVRFVLEFFRGDSNHLILWNFSEAQWVSLLVAFAVVGIEYCGGLPPSRWSGTVPLALGTLMIGVGVRRRFDPLRRFELLRPRHVQAIKAALDYLIRSRACADAPFATESSGPIQLVRTSEGYRFSGGEITRSPHKISHWSVSREDASVSVGEAQTLARVISWFDPKPGRYIVVQGLGGVCHILFYQFNVHTHPEE